MHVCMRIYLGVDMKRLQEIVGLWVMFRMFVFWCVLDSISEYYLCKIAHQKKFAEAFTDFFCIGVKLCCLLDASFLFISVMS